MALCYGASLEATARRFVRLSPEPAFFARLEFGASRSNPKQELRVMSASRSPALDAFIPVNKSVPRTHPIFRATDGEYVEATADMQSLHRPGMFRLTARPYPYNNNEGASVMRVLALGLKTPSLEVPPR